MSENIENKLHLIGDIVFKIITPNGSGSGFYLKKYDIIVTNYHVVKGFKQLCVEDNNKNRILGKVVLINPENDISFIKLETPPSSNTEIEIGDDSNIDTRDEVYVLGYPFGLPYTITKGIVSSKNQLVNGKHLIQTDAAVNPGNSGGAMVNTNAELIGITVSKFVGENTDNIGFGIPSRLLRDDLESLKQNIDSHFCIKCNSCKHLIFEKTTFCHQCGGSIKKELFDDFPISNISSTIEKIIQEIGINPIITRSNQEYWTFYYNQKFVRIVVDDEGYIGLSSPLFKMPQTPGVEFYKYGLSSNLGVYKIGIDEDEVTFLFRIHISDMLGKNKQEYIGHIRGFFDKLSEFVEYCQTNFQVQPSKYDIKLKS